MEIREDCTLNSHELREIGEALFGHSWQGDMAKAIGVPRQSIGHYLKSGGVRGTQTAAIVGLVARMAIRDLLSADARRIAVDARHAALVSLPDRFDAR
jgi:hypothetical protein